jgi:hypothetical protein
MAQLLLSAARSCELNVVFKCSQETVHVLQDEKMHQHYCAVYLAYERLKIEILVTPLPTALIDL